MKKILLEYTAQLLEYQKHYTGTFSIDIEGIKKDFTFELFDTKDHRIHFRIKSGDTIVLEIHRSTSQGELESQIMAFKEDVFKVFILGAFNSFLIKAIEDIGNPDKDIPLTASIAKALGSQLQIKVSSSLSIEHDINPEAFEIFKEL